MPDLLAALNRTRQDTEEALRELSSGRRVNQPSDDPAAAAILIQNHDQATFTARYLQSLSSIQGEFQTADSALNSVILVMQRALTLGVEGANGTLSDTDRSAVAAELQGIVASGVRYVGNDAVNAVLIGDGYQIAVNKPGSQLFTAPGHDVFQDMTGLIQAMQSNSGFTAALSSLRDAFDYTSGQRVFYGNTMNQAQSQATYLGSAKLQLSQQENTLAAADVASAASRLVNSQNATNATLAAFGRLSQLNLFDFLK
jgi:flagellar hook-associated protein 3 FlgL